MEKKAISFKNVLNAVVPVDNSKDSDRDIDISAIVNVVNGRADSFTNGQCVKHPDSETSGGSATFSLSNGHFTICFNNIASPDDMADIQRQAFAFVHSFDDLDICITTAINGES